MCQRSGRSSRVQRCRFAAPTSAATVGPYWEGQMDILNDGNLLARVLLTLATIGYGVITVKADFNRTHAANPLWTPHARFHVVWQITSYVGFALLAFALIWLPGPYRVERLYLAAGFAAVVYGAFFIA